MAEERDIANRSVGRRRLLKRASGVAAGVAGATVVGAVASSPAEAAAGDPVVLGASNTAGTTSTSIATTAPSATTLQLSNAGVATTANGYDVIGGQLRLVPPTNATGNPQYLAGTNIGDLGVTDDGTLYYAAQPTFSSFVYTTYTANQFVPTTPTRILDTRTAAGRAAVINPNGNLDSAGRLLTAHSIDIDLSGWVYIATAVHLNITVVSPLAGGYVSVLPGNTVISGAPKSSNINFPSNTVLANFAVVAVASTSTLTDVIKVFTSGTTHILLDVAGFTVNEWGQVNPAIWPQGLSADAKNGGKSRAELAQTGKPKWAKK
jgi:hypothetical protein